jgi:phosphotransacetylase
MRTIDEQADLKRAAVEYHEQPWLGKSSVAPTKQLINQRDLALANPNPEILPEDVKAVRDDAVIATGRSDYPNRVNNVLCFPFIFRGALDVGATTITPEMRVAAVRAIAQLAREEQSEVVATAKAAAEGGRCRVVFCEGEDERVLRAVQVVLDEGIARPIVVGRPAVIERRLERFGLRMSAGRDFEVVDPESYPRYRDYRRSDHEMTARRGVTEQYAKIEMRRRLTLIGAMMIAKGDADGILCGTLGTHDLHLHDVDQVIGRRPGANVYAAMNILMLPGRQIALADTHVNVDPTAAEIAEIAVMAAEQLQRLGITPRRSSMPHSTLQGNLLMLPGIDAANIGYRCSMRTRCAEHGRGSRQWPAAPGARACVR